jgi:hypothetical protein
VLAGRRRSPAAGEIEALVKELGVTVVPFGERECQAAVTAFLRDGRGRFVALCRRRLSQDEPFRGLDGPRAPRHGRMRPLIEAPRPLMELYGR